MPNFSGIWSAAQQFQARGQNLWPLPPGAPTIGTATAGTNNCAAITFSAPACTGKYPAGVSTYTVTSTPGCFTASGAASPLTVTGLTTGTSYTFKAKANGSNGLTGPCSAASNSITASLSGSQSYTSSGTYTWVAPAGVTSVSIVAVGGGGNVSGGGGGGGGGLGYRNNQSVTPGNSYTVIVGANQGTSSFCSTSVVRGGGASGLSGGTYTGTGGGNGGTGGPFISCFGGGGAGAGGYSGNGGNGGFNGGCATAGAGGGGGGGGRNGGGGGVGILGQGSNGTAGSPGSPGGGGSGGGNGVGVGGGIYGGGAGGSPGQSNNGTAGAVRIVWPGNTRTFPSTNVGAP